MAGVARRAGRLDEAELALRRALDNASMAGQIESTNRAREALLDLYVAAGRDVEGVPLSEALVRTQETYTADQARIIDRIARHAEVLRRAGRMEEAGHYQRRAELLRAARQRSAS